MRTMHIFGRQRYDNFPTLPNFWQTKREVTNHSATSLITIHQLIYQSSQTSHASSVRASQPPSYPPSVGRSQKKESLL